MSDAMSGLRGLMALHVALFHYLLIPSLQLHTWGNVHMSLFILLSGFSMSAAYSNHAVLDKRAFYIARFARTMPIVYLTHLAVAVLTPIGHGAHPDKFFKTVRTNFAATSMWVLQDGEPNWGFNGPAWTVSTLVAYYWLYPYLRGLIGHLAQAPTIGRRTRLALGLTTALAVSHGVIGFLRPDVPEEERNDNEPWQPGWLPSGSRGISIGLTLGALAGYLAGSGALSLDEARGARLCMPPWATAFAWLQFAIGVAMAFNGLPHIGKGYWPATGWALSRLPLFLMGAVAGATPDTDKGANALRWAKRTDAASSLYVGTLVLLSTISALKSACTDKTTVKQLGMLVGALSPLSQLVMPYVQLTIVLGLSRSHESRTAKLCLRPTCQWLGRISMALYLGHMPVYHWLVVLVNGTTDWTFGGRIGESYEAYEAWHKACSDFKRINDVADADCQAWQDAHNLGWWWVPLATILSLAVAAVMEKYVETPARTWLRALTKPRGTHEELDKVKKVAFDGAAHAPRAESSSAGIKRGG